jgi:hypothetical protein
MVPIGSLGDAMGGSARARIPDGSIASTIFVDHAREATSKNPVPEASPASITTSPVSQ